MRHISDGHEFHPRGGLLQSPFSIIYLYIYIPVAIDCARMHETESENRHAAKSLLRRPASGSLARLKSFHGMVVTLGRLARPFCRVSPPPASPTPSGMRAGSPCGPVPLGTIRTAPFFSSRPQSLVSLCARSRRRLAPSAYPVPRSQPRQGCS